MIIGKTKASLRSKVWIIFIPVLFLAIMGSVWLGSRYYVLQKAEKDIQNMLLQHKGVHHYVQRLSHPELYTLKKGDKIPESLYTPILFSSSYMVRNMHDFYNEERENSGLPFLYYKMAAESPRNPVNQADAFETELIRMFNKADAPESFRKVEKKDGQEYLYVAIPFLRNRASCLKCHGELEDAPVQLQQRYPGAGGYNEEIGYIRAIESLRAPLGNELTFTYIAMISSAVVCVIVFSLLMLNRRLDTLVIERTQRIKEQATALEESEENLSLTLNSIVEAVIATDKQCCITLMNPVAEQLTGYSFKEVQGKRLPSVLTVVGAKDREPSPHVCEQVLLTGMPTELSDDALLIAKDGTERQISRSGAPLHNAEGEVVGVVLVFSDVTKEKQLEEHLRQTEKMTAIGQLAGGVAHDFNNMLGGISGASELLEMTVGDNPQAMRYVELIQNATERTSGLTQKLLAFSRKGKLMSTPVDIHTAIMDAVSILERSVDKRITITTELNAEEPMVIGDPSQLQSGFLNMFVNARDAMPDGGELYITTRNVIFDEDYCRVESDFSPGSYLQITIQDTGSGIPEDIQAHIFEPFYTTKEVGKGTGLGLAAVYGMIQEHNGAIRLYSEQDKGTVFHIYLPSALEDAAPSTSKEIPAQHGSGTILLIDDEEIIRQTGSLLLENLGYKVLLAENGAEGVAMYEAYQEKIDLVLLDIVMPVMDGREAFENILAINSATKVILASGFAKDVEMDEMRAKGLAGFIMKPFHQVQLSHLIAEIMGKKKQAT